MLLIVIMLSGCQASRPDFAERSQQDCQRGDREACRMLDALKPSRPGPARPRAPSRAAQVQSDVQAITRGIDQAKALPSSRFQENAPTPEAPPPQGPAATPQESPPPE